MSEKEVKKCYSCNVEMQFVVEAPYRINWLRGDWKLLTGELAELGVKVFSLQIYLCPKCGRVESFADNKVKEHLLSHSWDV